MFLETSRDPHHLLFVPQDTGFPKFLNILFIGYISFLYFFSSSGGILFFHLTVLFLYDFQKDRVGSNILNLLTQFSKFCFVFLFSEKWDAMKF